MVFIVNTIAITLFLLGALSVLVAGFLCLIAVHPELAPLISEEEKTRRWKQYLTIGVVLIAIAAALYFGGQVLLGR